MPTRKNPWGELDRRSGAGQDSLAFVGSENFAISATSSLQQKKISGQQQGFKGADNSSPFPLQSAKGVAETKTTEVDKLRADARELAQACKHTPNALVLSCLAEAAAAGKNPQRKSVFADAG